ncbi:3'(2'),5'-bisphosphate nucleotidase CysQ [Oceaniserpentilla sp. 4NH20-0058]|uniref:3'(2'),5'-bisphosphate nucleotidase CysQ n=1 Tax=Oceaniserpentilla sp. 4NH20-0058 TaxID=3127660 RepID=UPI00310BD354
MQPNYAAVIELAKQAGTAILQIYNRSAYTVVEKSDDSPLTEADLAAHHIINNGLSKIINVPVISEEADIPNQEQRAQWQQFWLVDPLDGTKEFIDRNGEFTVNIALIQEGEPVFGLIYAPVTDECYYGGDGKAFCKVGDEPAIPLKASNPNIQIGEHDRIRILCSKRHALQSLDRLCEKLEHRVARVERISVGSALKLGYLASGQGEVYPRFGNVSEWDIAAGHAILRCVGGDILSLQYEHIRYGSKPSMIVPGFYAVGQVDFDWRTLLLS